MEITEVVRRPRVQLGAFVVGVFLFIVLILFGLNQPGAPGRSSPSATTTTTTTAVVSTIVPE